MLNLVRVFLGFALALTSALAAAAPAGLTLEQVTLLAAGPTDGRAVLQLPGKRLVELRVGEKLPGTAATLKSVSESLAVFEDQPASNQAPQTVWLRPNRPAERLRGIPDPAPVVAAAPVMVRVPVALPGQHPAAQTATKPAR